MENLITQIQQQHYLWLLLLWLLYRHFGLKWWRKKITTYAFCLPNEAHFKNIYTILTAKDCDTIVMF